MGGDRARHGVQMDHCGRPTAHAIAAGVPPPPTDGPLCGPPTRPYEGRMEGHTEPHQKVANEPGCTVPAGAGARTAHGPLTAGVCHALHRASALTEQLNDEVLDLALEPLWVLYPQTHIPPEGTSNHLGRPGLQRRVEAAHPGGVVEQWLTLRHPSAAQGHWYLHQLLLLPRAAPEHRRQNPYHTHPERRGARSFPQPFPRASRRGRAPGRGSRASRSTPPPRYSKGEGTAQMVPNRTARTAEGWPGRRPAGTSPEIPRGSGSTDQQTGRRWRPRSRPSPWVPWRRGRRNCRTTSPAATRSPASRPQCTRRQHPSRRSSYTSSGRRCWRTAGSIQGPQRDAPHLWHATLRGRTRVWDAGGGTPPPGPQQGEALVLQTAGYQTILHGHAGGYRSHVLAGGRWTVWHSTARQGAFPPLPHVHWQQGPTQAYYMSADPWPLAVLLHTVSAPNKRQEPGLVKHPALVWSPDQEEHLRAVWQGDAIRATDISDLHAGPITHARPAATLVVAQRGQQNPQWVVCMFSPAYAHILVCDPERLPGPEAVVRVADCTCMIVKALREGEHHALLLQVWLKDNARAARPGVWPAAAHPADLQLQLAVRTTVYHWLQAFRDLGWRGKPDRQISTTHWQA